MQSGTKTFKGKTSRVTSFQNKANVNIDYQLKVADKNKRQLQESYGKQIEKVEKKISKNEQVLHRILEEINEKENQIYEVQKVKLEGFKNEVEKFERIKNLVEEHLAKLSSDIYKSKHNERKLINQTYMLYEDYLSNNNEAYLCKNKIIELKGTLNQIEKTYPKDFEFLFEDIQLEKELVEIESIKKQINSEIKVLEKDKLKLKAENADKEERKELVDVEFKKIDEQIEESYKDAHLKNVEEYLVKHVSNLLELQNLQSLVQGFYSQKQLDVENEINVLLMNNLAEKLTEMKNEFYQIKNDKENQLKKIAVDIEEIKEQVNNKIKKSKDGSVTNNQLLIDEQVKAKREEGERLHNEINKLELNCKKKETLFNKYLILLRNKCVKNEDESFYKQNPCLILERNFEELFKNEMINSLREKRDDITEEELRKHEGTIDIYFRDLFERERTIQLILLQRAKIEAELKEHEKSINTIVDKISEIDNEIKVKKMRLTEVTQKLASLKQRIETRNRTLKMNLESLSENNFMEYLNSNEEVLKSMKKIYGNKILSKVFKAQKEKFFENVMLDHSFKKQKINEFVLLVNKYEETINSYDNSMAKLLESFKESSFKLDEIREFIEVKSREEQNLRDAKSDLVKTLDSMLRDEMEEITNEKIKLRQKLNCDFYFVKVKEIAQKIENLKQEKETILSEFFQFRDVIIEREQKLYKEDREIKNVLSLDQENINSDILSSNFPKSTERFGLISENDKAQIPYKVNSNKLNQMCEGAEREKEIPIESPIVSDDEKRIKSDSQLERVNVHIEVDDNKEEQFQHENSNIEQNEQKDESKFGINSSKNIETSSKLNFKIYIK